MGTVVAIPLHLAANLFAFAVAGALAVYGGIRRDEVGPGWWLVSLGSVALAGAALLSGALLSDDLTWPVTVRAVGYVLIAVGAAGGLGFRGTAAVAPGLLPAAPVGLHVTATVAGLAAALAALRGAIRARTALLAAGLVLWAVADGLAHVAGGVAAAASIVGSIVLASWVARRSRASLLARVAGSYLVVLLVLVIGLAVLGALLLGADLRRDELTRLQTAAETRVDEVVESWTVESMTIARLFAQDALAQALQEQAGGQLETVARAVAELPSADVVVLLDPEGRVLASFEWTVEPLGELDRASALSLAGATAVEPALNGAVSRGLVALGDGDIVAVGASPVFPTEDGQTRRDELAGVIAVGRRVADPIFLRSVAAAADADVTVVVGGSVGRSTLDDDVAEGVAAVVSGGETRGTHDADGQTLFVAAAAIPEVQGSWLVLTRDATEVAAAEERFTRGLFLTSLAGLVVALAVAWWAARRTTEPVLRLTDAAERVAAGDLETRTGIDQPDEVGRLASTFDGMTTSLGERERALVQAAEVETALRQRLEVLTASMGEALIAVDEDGVAQTVNPAAEQLLGIDADEAVGRPVQELLRGADTSGVDLITALGSAGTDEPRSVRGVVDTGHGGVPVTATAAPLRSEGARVGRVYVLRDISGEAEVERMKTEFLSNVSHELRTPLTPIKGYAEVMRRRSVPQERVAEFADSIVQSTARLERIIGMLVDFAALEAGRIEIRPEPTSLDDVVSEVLTRWRARAPDRRITRRLERDLPDVLVDPELLHRMLEELIDNAVKFSSEPVRITARWEGDGKVRLTVRDQGVGIDPEDLASVTDDFRQIDGSATRTYGGLGLGLSLVRRIADGTGAELEVESEPGDGTQMHLLLPVVDEGTRT